MANNTVIFKRSAEPGKIPNTSDIPLGQIAINTHDGKMFLQREEGSNNYVIQIGAGSVPNVYYVSKNGVDSNDGLSLSSPFLTIAQALSVATTGSTVFVKSGDYTELNPLTVPAGVSIVGDNLRTVTVRPLINNEDLFYVNNKCYLTGMTFRSHVSPAAAVAFNPDASAGNITTSPYVQNCSSITTTGTGMRIDGSVVGGTRSMVLDAYTQFNEGGIGVHIINSGYAQLVSLFTICCTESVLCESGGQCSITNSNSSFGTRGLVADGLSPILFTVNTIGVNPDVTRANVTFKINEDQIIDLPVGTSAEVTIVQDNVDIITNIIENGPSVVTTKAPISLTRSTDANVINAAIMIEANRDFIKADTLAYISGVFGNSFRYDKLKCARDTGLIVDALAQDLLFSGNTQSTFAGLQYWDQIGYTGSIEEELTVTINAINFTSNLVQEIIVNDLGVERYTSNTQITGDGGTAVESGVVATDFDLIIDILTNGTVGVTDRIIPNSLTANTDTNVQDAFDLIQANRSYIQGEVIGYVENYKSIYDPGFVYNQELCYRDVGYMVDSVCFDLLYGGNRQAVQSGVYYYSFNTESTAIPGEIPQTTAAYDYIKTIAGQIILGEYVAPYQNSYPNIIAVNDVMTFDEGLNFYTVVSTTPVVSGETTVTFAETLPADIPDDLQVRAYRRSFISASGHTFEYVGTGTVLVESLPEAGALPIQENQIIESNGGKVYFSSTDQFGNFRIGEGLFFNNAQGIIEGRTFNRSLFAVMTPYILALEG
jgi:hypothetical protein